MQPWLLTGDKVDFEDEEFIVLRSCARGRVQDAESEPAIPTRPQRATTVLVPMTTHRVPDRRLSVTW
jgi:hypothetical protein